MTSVEDALSITRAGSVFTPVAAPRATKSVTHTVVTPRVSATLERRRQWERRYRMRLRITDAGVILFAVGITAAVQLMTGVAGEEALRNGILLATLWYLMLSALHTRDAALFRASATEFCARNCCSATPDNGSGGGIVIDNGLRCAPFTRNS